MSLRYTVKEYSDQSKQSDYPSYVVGVDIGGTNTNLGVAGIKNKKMDLLFSLSFKTNDLTSITPAVSTLLEYAKSNYNIDIKFCCIGAAGVVNHSGDYAKLTNAEWDVDTKEILNETSLSSCFIINDFQAIGYGINLLNYNNENDIYKIREINNQSNTQNAIKVIIGAGTGLGKSILVHDKNFNAYVPIPSEGGHGDFPIQNDFEMELTNYLKENRSISQPLTYEELLSGRGLEGIYQFIKEKQQFENTRYTSEIESADEKSMLISKYRTADETCKETFRLFTRFYGRCAKNLVLDTLAYGGLYVAGGIASKNKDIFESKEFIDEFENSYRRSDVLKDTPIYVVVNYDVSLYGACFAAMYKFKDKIME